MKRDWINVINQRLFLEKFANEKSIKTPEEWSKITKQQIIESGGGSLLKIYGFSPFRMLSSIFREQNFNPELFRLKGKWKSKNNQRLFLEQLAKKLKVNSFQDWGSITNKQIIEAGGIGILNAYGDSIFKMLNSVFPGQNIKREWFQTRGNWTHFDSQRKFLLQLAEKYKIKYLKDWGKITRTIIIKEGGIGLLKQFGNSPFKMIQSIFREHTFEAKWFHLRTSWQSTLVQKRFLDQLAKKSNINHLSDWGKITKKQIIEEGGSGLLSKYGYDIFNMLENVYSDVKFKREWFPVVIKGGEMFQWSSANSRNFLEMMASKYSLQDPNDWKKITNSMIHQNGGMGLLQYYGNLSLALQSNFPNQDWFNYSNTNNNTQLKLKNVLHHLFPF